MRKSLVAVLAALALGACAATHLDRSWVAPGLHDEPFHHIVAIAITRDHNRRVAMEEAMAGQLKRAAEGLQAEPSYKLLNDEQIQREDDVRNFLAASGFDGAVVMRVTQVNREDVWVPGSTSVAPMYYRTFWGYYSYWRPITFAPGYMETDRTVHVESALYEVPEGDLIYSAMSQTLNPSSPEELVREVGDRVARDLTAKGLISNGPPR